MLLETPKDGNAGEPARERCRSAGPDEPRRAARTASVAEDVGGEAVDRRAATPGVGREARLDACLRQELLASPLPFGRDLRQQRVRAARRARRRGRAVRSTMAPGSSGSIRSSGPSTDTSTSRPSSSAARTGWNRGSSRAALTATRATSSPRGRRHSSVPMQPRSCPWRFNVTNAPLASGNGAAAGISIERPITVRVTAVRAMSTSARCSWSVNIGECAERPGHVADDRAVVAGNLPRVHVFQHPSLPRAAGPRRNHHGNHRSAAARDEPSALRLPGIPRRSAAGARGPALQRTPARGGRGPAPWSRRSNARGRCSRRAEFSVPLRDSPTVRRGPGSCRASGIP